MGEQVREGPILFNSEMVVATLDDRKTATRRLVKGRALQRLEEGFTPEFVALLENGLAPYQVGDRLWVRETWCERLGDVSKGMYIYKAHKEPQDDIQQYALDQNEWRPSIHMPRSAARLFLRVKRVWIERLQDITDADAKKEGVLCREEDHDCELAKVFPTASIAAFSRLWDSAVKKSELNLYGWAANPWVWVIEFEREEQS